MPGDPPAAAAQALQLLNQSLHKTQDDEVAAAALTSAQVIDLVDGLNGPRSVRDQVERGRLLSFNPEAGRAVRYPRWQFDRSNRAVVPVIAKLVSVCHAQFAGDVVAFDLAVRSIQDRLGHRSVEDLLAARRWDEAVAAIDGQVEQAG